MATGACYWSGNGSYSCPCLGGGQPDVLEPSALCLECGHPLGNHVRIERSPSNPSASQVLLPRHQTVRNLANLLYEERVVLARGTLSSGKSFLAKSLHMFLREQGVRSVYNTRFPPYLEDCPSVLQYLVEVCKMGGFAASSHDLMCHEFVFIIDDAHTTYNNSALWLLLHSMNQDRLTNIPGARFCLFGAFGTPDRGTIPYSMGCDPLVFIKDQHLALSQRFATEITIFYTRDEFDSYVEMHLQGRGSDYDICEVLKNKIFELTEGQPELTAAFMYLCDLWYEAWYKADKVDLLTFGDYEISQFFEVRGMLEGTIAVVVDFVGLPLSPEKLFPPEQEFEVLRQAHYHNSQGLLFDPSSEAMLSCLTKGWLHLEEATQGGLRCFFPTGFHNRLVEYLVGVQELEYPTPCTLNRAELYLMRSTQNMTAS